MCGIYAVINDTDAAETVLAGLKRLEYRGYDSWGIAIALGGKARVEKHAGRITADHSTLSKSSIGLGHTRWATHGGVTQANAHPHLDCSGKTVVVHNGILENYLELKAALGKHTFKSQTDTEIFAHLIEELRKKYSFVESVRRAFAKAKGLNALIALDPESNTIIVAKIGSPVVIGKDATRYFLASDPASLAGQATSIRPLEDGEMVVMTPQGMTLSTLKGKQKALKLEPFTMKLEETTKDGYPHFMLKELHEQPAVLRATVSQSRDELLTLVRQAKRTKHMTFIGCGGASYPCLFAKYAFAALAPEYHVDVYQGNELEHFMHDVSTETYPIFISQSGETIDLVQPAQALKKKGVRFGCLTNVYSSSLYRLADDKVLLKAGPEISVASTKSFTNMVGQAILLAGMAGNKETATTVKLKQAAQHVATTLTARYTTRHLKPIAKKLSRHQHIFVIGRGLSYPIAFEAALKFKEIAYIHAEAFAGGELKHGMIALIQKGSPCLVLTRNDETLSDILSNAAEVKARGGFIVGIGAKRNPVFDEFLPIQESGIATCIEQASVVQQLAYYTAAVLGRDIDKPRNLAKSVVVK